MRSIMLVVALGIPSLVGAADNKPITVEEALKKIGETCTVEMEVKSTGKSKRTTVFLNSHKRFSDPGNLSIAIGGKAVEQFKAMNVDDPTIHFKDKTILVTGMVKQFKDRVEIFVTSADQI